MLNSRSLKVLVTWVLVGGQAAAWGQAEGRWQRRLADQLRESLPPHALARLSPLCFRLPLNPTAVAFSPDGSIVACGAEEPMVYLWETSSGQLLRRLALPLGVMPGRSIQPPQPFFPGCVACLSFSPNGKTLAVAAVSPAMNKWAAPGQVYIMDIATGKCDNPRIVDEGSICQLAFSPDSTLLACWGARQLHFGCYVRWVFHERPQAPAVGASAALPSLEAKGTRAEAAPNSMAWEHAVTVWHVPRRQLVARLVGHTQEITAVRFSPDSRQLASGAMDETVRLWDVTSGRELRRLSVEGLWLPGVVARAPGNAALASDTAEDRLPFAFSPFVLDFLPGFDDGSSLSPRGGTENNAGAVVPREQACAPQFGTRRQPLLLLGRIHTRRQAPGSS